MVLPKLGLILGVLGLIASAIGYFMNSEQFFHSYLVAFCYWLSIGLGGLFLTLLHYLTGAVWSIVFRRLYENFMILLPVLALFFIPILFGIHDLYHWSHADAVEHDAILKMKTPYLNIPFFAIRAGLFFLVWSLYARTYYSLSLKNDRSGDPSCLISAKRKSPFAVIVFAVTVSFAAFDWLMSLDPHWYSTIFGVYYFAGATLATYSLITIFVIYLERLGVLKDRVTKDHYHDLGKMLFTFTVFWAYIAFSQYFLIWYANIPEETVWFLQRWEGSWKIVSLVLAVGHFLAPFFVLLIRAMKRNLVVLAVMSMWLLIMHFVDLYWLVLPNLHKHHAVFHWLDITTLIGIGGIFIALVFRLSAKYAIIPINDPRLKESIYHKL